MELEQSRAALEKHGIRVAAISYDPVEVLRKFGEDYRIGFPLLSDVKSAAIRAFGILNVNIAEKLRAHGVPHPVNYLVAADGTVVRKYFVPNYMHRVAASAVVLSEFGEAGDGAAVAALRSGAVSIEVRLSGARAFAGQEMGFVAKFELEPGWHLSAETTVRFEDDAVESQRFDMPAGRLQLRFPLEAGERILSGVVDFQQCSETVCEPPESLRFELPLTIDPFVVVAPVAPALLK